MTALDFALERIERRLVETMPRPTEEGFTRPLTPEQMGRIKALSECAEIIRQVQKDGVN
jgi:hypothetical protein